MNMHRLVHKHVVHTVRIAPNGQLLATGDQKGTTRLWDCTTGKELRVLGAPEWNAVYPLAWSPDSRLLLTARGWQEYPTEAGLALWDTGSGRLVWSTRKVFSRTAVFTKSGKTIVTEDADWATLNCLSAVDGELLVSMTTVNTNNFQHPDWIMYTPGGHFTSSHRLENYVHWDIDRKVGPDADFSGRFNDAKAVARHIR
jgi:WD40 repeat protein